MAPSKRLVSFIPAFSRRCLPGLLALTLLALGSSAAQAEDAWVKDAVDAVRWPEATEVVLHLDAGTKVAVVFRENEKVRIRHEQDYVWVPQAALSATDPAAVVEPAVAEPGKLPASEPEKAPAPKQP